jgi:hypothetical protein
MPIALNNPPPPISTPAPAKPSSVALENWFLAEQVADDFETSYILRRGGIENDPLSRGFAHNGYALAGATIVTNLAIRLLPAGRTKTFLMKVLVGGEGANDAANCRAIVLVNSGHSSLIHIAASR